MSLDTEISVRQDRQLRNRTMKIITLEGCVSVFVFALHAAFLIPYLTELGANELEVGFCASLPALIFAGVQLLSPLVQKMIKSPKKPVIFFNLAHGLLYLPLGFVYFIKQINPVWASITLVCMATIFHSLGSPIWSDWISHIIPRRRRGKYFAKRNRIITIIQLAVTISAGFLLDRQTGNTLAMFTIIWVFGSITRTSSAYLIKLYYEPQSLRKTGKVKFTLIDFIKSVPSTMFGRFAVSLALFSFSVHIAVPFFPVHMLENLHFSYFQYSLIVLMPTVTAIFTLRLWGRVSDNVGYVPPIRLCAVIIAALPVFWVATGNFYALLMVNCLAGLAWTGFNLSVFNYSISAIESSKRSKGLAYLNSLNFFCVFCGATAGGFLADKLPMIGDFQLQSVFTLSALLRVAAFLMFLTLKNVERHPGPMGPVERFFFDPRHSLRSDMIRFTRGSLRRPF